VRLCGCAAQRTLTARHYPAALTSASSSKTGTGTKARTPEMVGAAETQAGENMNESALLDADSFWL
jgi:hypothetical protein